ncbi:MAG: type I-C CRISPR-associated endonuclease Cas1c [Bacilli bacterium]|nr:type I-C CRISPR-associated endonuclease Cas1c [Bacilli bacterium]
MRHLLNTLYVTNPNAYVGRERENVVVRIDDKIVLRRPIHILESIVCFNYVGISPKLIHLCAENNVSVSFLDEHGNFMGKIISKVHGNVLLRRTQYRYADNKEKSLQLARNFIIGKIINCRSVLKRAIRDHQALINVDLFNKTIEKLNSAIDVIQKTDNFDELRGIEGDAAKLYFSLFNNLILHQKKDFYFVGRSRRPPLDNINALLSYTYTLLTHEMTSALETIGLDPYVGFLHTDRPGRVSLSLDLIEELRPYMADRFVLSIINRKQMTKSDFIKKESGGIILTNDSRIKFLETWQKRKRETIIHPFINERIEIGLIPYVQSMLLSRYMRGDLDSYPPFLIN